MNVVVLGGSKGLGKACVEEFLSQSHQVSIVARTCPKDLKGKVEFIQTDFHCSEEITSLGTKLKNKKIDILVNNSGGPVSKPFEQVSSDEFLQEIQSHLLVAHEVTKAVAPHMKTQKFGRIINIISVTANNPLPNMIVSNTIRGAMVNWSKTLSKELASFKITVNNVLPGYTKTERLDEVVGYAADAQGVDKEVIFDKLLSDIPAERFGEPSELASIVGFLASEKASYINGQSISIDGGWTPCV